MAVSRVSPYLPGFVAGELCLDFVNTVDPRHADDRDDFLRDYDALLAWGESAGLLSDAGRLDLVQRGHSDPGSAAAVHERAVDLREALYRVFAPGIAKYDPADLDCLTAEVHRAWATAEPLPRDQGFEWGWPSGPDLDRVLWPVARSAADLLTAARSDRIRECEGANGCGWLFIDTSKNGRRRWCDMRVCGNRAKARRQRQRASGTRTRS